MAIDKLQKDALSNTVTANIASLTVGANVSINSSACGVGSGRIVAGGITLPSNFGVSSNTTNLLENRGGQLFFSGRRVDLVKSVYGYTFGGYTGGPYVATADRTTFSTSATAASTASNLTQGRGFTTGVSDRSTYGYVLGGWSGAVVTTAERVTFSTSGTAASTASNLSVAREANGGVSDGAIYGYALGGYTGAGAYAVTADRISFSTSVTAASTVSNLTQARYAGAGVSDGAIYGYSLGGYTGSFVYTAVAERIAFRTSTTAASTSSNLSQARRTDAAGMSDNAVYGYVMGGTTGAVVTTADRITFSTSATAAITASNLSQARSYASGMSDGTVYGYIMGGDSGAYVATADRTTFSTSATAASTTSNLSQARWVGGDGVSDGAV